MPAMTAMDWVQQRPQGRRIVIREECLQFLFLEVSYIIYKKFFEITFHVLYFQHKNNLEINL